MDEGHQKQTKELNQELLEVKASAPSRVTSVSVKNQFPQTQAQLSTQTGERKPISGRSTEAEGASSPPHNCHSISSEGKLRKLEMELAQTKLALVESQCCNQELEKKLECASNTTAQHRHTRNTSFLGRGKKKT